MLDVETFRALCKRMAEEKDPTKLEILKERMRVLLAQSQRKSAAAYHPDIFVN